MQLCVWITFVFEFTYTLFCNETFILATQIVLWIRNATSIFFIPIQLTTTTLALEYTRKAKKKKTKKKNCKRSDWTILFSFIVLRMTNWMVVTEYMQEYKCYGHSCMSSNTVLQILIHIKFVWWSDCPKCCWTLSFHLFLVIATYK